MLIHSEVHSACSYSTVLSEEAVDAVACELQPVLYSVILKTVEL